MKLKDDELQIIVDETLPAMPQNVLGLNHADILQRVCPYYHTITYSNKMS